MYIIRRSVGSSSFPLHNYTSLYPICNILKSNHIAAKKIVVISTQELSTLDVALHLTQSRSQPSFGLYIFFFRENLGMFKIGDGGLCVWQAAAVGACENICAPEKQGFVGGDVQRGRQGGADRRWGRYLDCNGTPTTHNLLDALGVKFYIWFIHSHVHYSLF